MKIDTETFFKNQEGSNLYESCHTETQASTLILLEVVRDVQQIMAGQLKEAALCFTVM